MGMPEYAPICLKQQRYIQRCNKSWLNVAEGGKRAGKNITNLIAWAACLEDHPDKLHLAAGVSISAARLNIIDSNGYGLRWIFHGRCRSGQYEGRDALYIRTRTGEKVVLITGGRANGDEAKIKGNTYGSVYVTEANECCQPFIQECFTRTLTSTDRKIFFDLNPKPPAHWFYTDLLNFYDREAAAGRMNDYNYEHFTVADNLSLTKKNLHDLLLTYDKNSYWYAADILGLRTAPNGVIFDMWSEKQNTFAESELAPNFEDVCDRIIGIDYGTHNPTVFLDIYDDGTTFWVNNEYYYDSTKTRRQKTDSEYADDFERFINFDVGATIIIDPSASSFQTELRNRGYRVRDANNDVQNGIRAVATLIKKRYVRVRADKCPNLIREIGSYVWDEKAILRGEEAPLKENDHACDALRYAIKTTIKRWRLAA